jgi:hypothetical protein
MEKQDLLVNYRYIVISFGNTQVHSRDLTIGRTNTFLIETLVFFLSLETLGEEFPLRLENDTAHRCQPRLCHAAAVGEIG